MLLIELNTKLSWPTSRNKGVMPKQVFFFGLDSTSIKRQKKLGSYNP